MDRLTDPVGLRLPREARLWWGWHDGAEPQPPGPAGEYGPGRAFLSLAQAVEECQVWREVMGHVEGDYPDPNWNVNWLPIDGEKRAIVLDCGVAFDAPVPVRGYFVEDPTAGAEGVRSMGELIQVWIRALDSGAWVYNRGEDHWEYHMENVVPGDQPLELT